MQDEKEKEKQSENQNELKSAKVKIEEFQKNISKAESDIDKLENEVNKESEKRYNRKASESELDATRLKKENKDIQMLKEPDFLLPEVGVLYETSDSFYLEIEDDKDLDKAEELCKRYRDHRRICKLVAKED